MLPKCGDGIRTDDEACDDGNTLDGDCCSATCTLEPTGTACSDDLNACTSDRCDGAGTCVHEPADGVCDDGDACTSGDTCVAGACAGTAPVACGPCMRCDAMRGCVGAAASGCLPPARSELALRRADTPGNSRLTWRWWTRQAPASTSVGWQGTEDWTLCLFDGPPDHLLSRSILTPDALCGARPCWSPSFQGLRYVDPLRTTGIEKIKIATRLDGKATISVAGGGPALDMPALPVEPPLTVQLSDGDGRCWEARYPSVLLVQGPTGLRARGGP
jgi:cysteine-rich repeat protein